ncbi:MAG: hypothetical protein ACRYGR_09355 [Janthinobacterium lividum]
MLKVFGSIFFMRLAVTSCGDSEPPKDLAYYWKHEDERKQKIKVCEKQLEAKFMQYAKEGKQEISPKEFEPTQNCKNAMEADVQYNHEISSHQSFGLRGIEDDLSYFSRDDKALRKAIEACKTKKEIIGGSKLCKNALEVEKIKQNESKK